MVQPTKPHARDTINRISMPALTLLLVALFWLLLIAAYCIPTDFMKDNLIESDQILKTENVYPASYATGKSYDNFTVAIMLDEAALGNENPIKDSVEARYYFDPDVMGVVPLFRTSSPRPPAPGSVGIVAGSSSRATV